MEAPTGSIPSTLELMTPKESKESLEALLQGRRRERESAPDPWASNTTPPPTQESTKAPVGEPPSTTDTDDRPFLDTDECQKVADKIGNNLVEKKITDDSSLGEDLAVMMGFISGFTNWMIELSEVKEQTALVKQAKSMYESVYSSLVQDAGGWGITEEDLRLRSDFLLIEDAVCRRHAPDNIWFILFMTADWISGYAEGYLNKWIDDEEKKRGLFNGAKVDLGVANLQETKQVISSALDTLATALDYTFPSGDDYLD